MRDKICKIAAHSFLIFLCLGVRLGLAGQDAENRFVYPEYSKKISMDFRDASLMDILKIFSKQSGMNYIAASEVSSKKITLFISDIPVEEALAKILDANDLTYEMKPGSDIFIIKAKPIETETLITKVYLLKYVTLPSSKLNSTISIAGVKASSNGLLAAVKEALSKSGHVDEDSRTNSLVITDVPQQFPIIEDVIAKLDTPVPQILIEVEMLDVSKATGDKLGFNFTTSSGDAFAPLTITEAAKLAWSRTTLKPPMTNDITNAYDMKVVLDFSRSQKDTRTLARPRLLTLNNETAEIKISSNEAISVQQVQSTTTGSTGQNTITPERTQTGVFLTVTPQANLATGEILMAVYPKVIQATLSNLKLPAGASPIKDTEERGSQSILKVKNGETIALGGLLREEYTNVVDKLPVFGDLPLVGSLFRHKQMDTSQRELIIFITPHIVDDKNKASLHLERVSSKPFKPQVKYSMDHLEQMGEDLTAYETRNLKR